MNKPDTNAPAEQLAYANLDAFPVAVGARE